MDDTGDQSPLTRHSDARADAVGRRSTGSPFRFGLKLGATEFSAEGDVKSVFEAFDAFKALIKDASASGHLDVSDQSPVTYSSKEVVSGTTKLPLPVFLKSRSARSNSEAAAAIAVWAKRNRGVGDFDSDGMLQLWRDSARKLPGNLSRDLGVAAKEGWLERLGDGKYRITAYGERHVDESQTAKS